MEIEDQKIKDLLKLKDGGVLFHREGQELEFKEQFNLAGLAEYFKDFAAFANNKGGYMIFGVQDAPRIPIGLNKKSIELFQKIDPARISGHLLDIFSGDISWKQGSVEVEDQFFGAFYIYPAETKPIIAKKDEGKEHTIKNGEVYYRYGGRTQKIQYAELENIINRRIEQNNKQWLDLMSKIGSAGPQNAAILDTEKSLIEKGSSRVLVLDDNLASKLKFIKEGEFVEKGGATALKLVGDVVPVDKVEIIKKIKEDLTSRYPLSAAELADEVKKHTEGVGINKIWQTIKETDLKNNADYAEYNFRNKKQKEKYLSTGKLPSTTPTIYNHKAVDFLVKILKN